MTISSDAFNQIRKDLVAADKDHNKKLTARELAEGLMKSSDRSYEWFTTMPQLIYKVTQGNAEAAKTLMGWVKTSLKDTGVTYDSDPQDLRVALTNIKERRDDAQRGK